MTDHPCKHDAEIAVMAASIERIEVAVNDISTTLKGNGKPGLCTEMALMKQRQGWIWAGLASLATVIVTWAGFLLFGV